jgi:hypothetical protein
MKRRQGLKRKWTAVKRPNGQTDRGVSESRVIPSDSRVATVRGFLRWKALKTRRFLSGELLVTPLVVNND